MTNLISNNNFYFFISNKEIHFLQSRSSYENVHSVRENQILQGSYSDYYDNPNPNLKQLDRYESPYHREMSGCGNRFQAEMKEIDAVHIVPQICVEVCMCV